MENSQSFADFNDASDENALNSERQKAKVDDSKLKEFFIEELKDIFWAENQLIQSLPMMKDAATSPELQAALEEHKNTTQTHVSRLRNIFEMLAEQPQGKICEAIEGLTKEAESIIDSTEVGTATRDVGLILAAQKIEHYEIATYGGLAQLARTLGFMEVATQLDITLEEEKNADHLLTTIAESHVNYQARAE